MRPFYNQESRNSIIVTYKSAPMRVDGLGLFFSWKQFLQAVLKYRKGNLFVKQLDDFYLQKYLVDRETLNNDLDNVHHGVALFTNLLSLLDGKGTVVESNAQITTSGDEEDAGLFTASVNRRSRYIGEVENIFAVIFFVMIVQFSPEKN